VHFRILIQKFYLPSNAEKKYVITLYSSAIDGDTDMKT